MQLDSPSEYVADRIGIVLSEQRRLDVGLIVAAMIFFVVLSSQAIFLVERTMDDFHRQDLLTAFEQLDRKSADSAAQ
jgi:hypothetical protein